VHLHNLQIEVNLASWQCGLGEKTMCKIFDKDVGACYMFENSVKPYIYKQGWIHPQKV
jgi:hypothetical protein